MLNPDVKAGKPFFNDEPLSKYEVCVLVGVLGDLQGQVICGMSAETAKKIISQMLYAEVNEIDEMGESAICELKNIIVGTASTNLSLDRLQMSYYSSLIFNWRLYSGVFKAYSYCVIDSYPNSFWGY